MQETYREHQSEFQKIIDNAQANRVLVDFTSEAAFLKRLSLHKEFINSSQIKRTQTDSLYFMELNEKARVVNMLN
jgi:hypothetical protein